MESKGWGEEGGLEVEKGSRGGGGCEKWRGKSRRGGSDGTGRLGPLLPAEGEASFSTFTQRYVGLVRLWHAELSHWGKGK